MRAIFEISDPSKSIRDLELEIWKGLILDFSFLAEERNPCSPSPCGLNSQCRELNGQAICSCLPTFIGTPPNCRAECTVSSDCPVNRACKNRKCADPCPGICGINARCEVINHSPICSCNAGFTGDPFVTCFQLRKYMPSSSLGLLNVSRYSDMNRNAIRNCDS